MFGMRWMLEIFLQMHERAGCLDQGLIKARQFRISLDQPQLLDNIMRFIIFLRVPQLEEGDVIILRRPLRGRRAERTHKVRNPLAFIH